MSNRPQVSTTNMLVNPDVARSAANPHRSTYGQKAPVIITDTSEEADRYYKEEDEEDEEEELEEEDFGDEEEDEEEEEEESARPARRSFVRSQLDDARAEKKDLLLRLEKIIARQDRTSAVIPHKTYNLDTPVAEVREIVELCEGLIQERARQVSENFGVQRLNQFTCGLAGMIEAANINYLDPENQFAVDGFSEEMDRVVQKGDLDEIHRRIWDIIRDKLGVVDNPFLQWGLVFGSTLISYNNKMKKAYADGALPDPRTRRAEVAEEEAVGIEQGLDDYASAPPGAPNQSRVPISNMGMGTGLSGPTPMAMSDSEGEDEERGAGYGLFGNDNNDDDGGGLDF